MKLVLNGLYKLPLGDGSGTLQSVFRGVHGELKRVVFISTVYKLDFPLIFVLSFQFLFTGMHTWTCVYTLCGTFPIQLVTTHKT